MANSQRPAPINLEVAVSALCLASLNLKLFLLSSLEISASLAPLVSTATVDRSIKKSKNQSPSNSVTQQEETNPRGRRRKILKDILLHHFIIYLLFSF